MPGKLSLEDIAAAMVEHNLAFLSVCAPVDGFEGQGFKVAIRSVGPWSHRGWSDASAEDLQTAVQEVLSLARDQKPVVAPEPTQPDMFDDLEDLLG